MANANVGSIEYDARINTSKMRSDANDADNIAKGLGDKIGKGFQAAEAGSKVVLASIAAIGAAAVVFGKKSVDAYFAAEEAQTKLRTNLLNVKGATDANVESLGRLASKLQSVGVIEDDVIKAGMSQLATFNLQGATIEKLTPKITDMVAQLKGHNATSEDMVGINNLVGKVMTGNVGALARYGVTLDENQKKVLENGTESEKAAKLVEVLGQNYGNVNEALRKTPQGQITALKNSFGDLQEGLGELIVRGLAPLMAGFTAWTTKVADAGGFVAYFSQLIKDNEGKLYLLAGAITGAVVPAIGLLTIAFIKLMFPLWPFIAAGMIIAGLAYLIKENWATLSPVFDTLRTTILNLWNNFLPFVNWLKSVAITYVNFLKIAWDAMQPSIHALAGTLTDRLMPAFLKLYQSLLQLWHAINPGFMTVVKVLAVIVGAVLVAAWYVLINVINIAISVIGWIAQVISHVIRWISQFISWIGSANAAIGNFIGNAISWFGGLPGRILGALGSVGNLLYDVGRDIINGMINGVKNMAGALADAVKGVVRGVVNIAKSALDSNSPSKVFMVIGKDVSLGLAQGITKGGSAATAAIGNVAGSLSSSFGGNMESTFGNPGSVGLNSINGIDAGAGGSPVTVNLNMTGIMARSKADERDIAKSLVNRLNEELTAQGQPAIGGGNI